MLDLTTKRSAIVCALCWGLSASAFAQADKAAKPKQPAAAESKATATSDSKKPAATPDAAVKADKAADKANEAAAGGAPATEAGEGATAEAAAAEEAGTDTNAASTTGAMFTAAHAAPEQEAPKQPLPPPWRKSKPGPGSEPEPEPKAEPAPERHFEDGPFAVGSLNEFMFNRSTEYDFFDEDNVLIRSGVWFGVDMVHMSRLALSGELGWGVANTEAEGLLSSEVDTALSSHTVHLALTLRHETLDQLWPHLRVGGGLSFMHAEFTTDRDGDFEDNQTGPFVSFGAGLTLKTPAGLMARESGAFGTSSLGVRVEAGMRLAASASFDLEPSEEPDENALPVNQVGLGELSRVGPYISLSVLWRI